MKNMLTVATAAGLALVFLVAAVTVPQVVGSASVSDIVASSNNVYLRPMGHVGWYDTVASGDTTLTAVNMPSYSTTCTGTCTLANDVSDTNYVSMIKHTTATTSGNSCGDCSGPFTMTRATATPLSCFIVRTDPAAVTTVSYYIGLASASLDQVTTLAGANSIKGCYFRFDTGLGDTNWVYESSDGTTASTIAGASSVAVAAATTYLLCVDDRVSGTCNYYINDTTKVAASKSTNINADSTLYAPVWTVTTRTTAARSLSVQMVQLWQL